MTAPGSTTATEAENLTLASCQVQYFDVLYSRPVQHSVDCVIVLNPNITGPVLSDAVDEIELHKLRCEVADTLGQANKMADKGNFIGARDTLHRARVRVRDSRVCRQALAVHLMDTLKESLEGIQDKVTYQQHGKSLMQNYAGSHWQQRSCTSPSSEGYVKHKTQLLAPGVMRLRDAAEGSTSSRSTVSESPYRKGAKQAMISKFSSKHKK